MGKAAREIQHIHQVFKRQLLAPLRLFHAGLHTLERLAPYLNPIKIGVDNRSAGIITNATLQFRANAPRYWHAYHQSLLLSVTHQHQLEGSQHQHERRCFLRAGYVFQREA
ncbi:hypothetical protein ExPECSC003_03150 [Escherichia coli]|nr:Uncharacterised protein [Klebsiella pneumoniae]VAE50046.1 Uncharacterised protein [Klebsiella aerogenes]GCL24790.1 hypothetical protein BvCmsE63A_03313 [Escherichia coli]SLY50285.1 Uncharacterised protein [Klebsiella pneumoniae]SLY73395.1 Uncharacterised protein [Klebsiella pneumoniae]